MLVHRTNRPKEMSGTTSSYESLAWAKGKRVTRNRKYCACSRLTVWIIKTKTTVSTARDSRPHRPAWHVLPYVKAYGHFYRPLCPVCAGSRPIYCGGVVV